MSVMKKLRRRFLAASLASISALTLCSGAAAQPSEVGYPARPLRILVGFAPGGSADTVARLLAQQLTASMSQPVIVENKAGAGGAIAADTVAKAPADGYTILLLPSGHASSAAMRRSLPYDALKDFSFVSTVTTYPMFVAVAAKSPIVSFNDLLQRAKASPGRLSYSSVGVGTGHHLLGEWINSEAKIELNHIPYKGAAPALTDILGGQVDVMLETATTVIPQQRAGKLRVLAVTSDAGKDLIPGTPAVSDSIPSVKYESWLGVALPAQTPRAIVNRLNADIARAVQNPELQGKLAELGGRASPSTPEHFTKRVESDIAHFRRIVAARKIPLE